MILWTQDWSWSMLNRHRYAAALLLTLLFLSSLCVGQAYNAFQQTTFTAVGTASPLVENTTILFHQLSWSGTPTTCQVSIDSSPDNTAWTVGGILAAQTCTAPGSSAITPGSANYVRVNVSTWSVNPVTIVYKGWTQNPAGALTTPVTVTNGGTGVSSFTQGQLIVAGATTLASSAISYDCSQFSGATLDVILNKCQAFVITSPSGIADMRALGTGFSGSQSINSLVQINQLLAPTPVKSTTGLGTPFGTSQVVTITYTITSPSTTTPASSEAQITMDASCPGSGNCFVGMSAPLYPGSGTTYTMSAFAGGLGFSELACPSTAIASPTAFYGTGAGGCNGAAVVKNSNRENYSLLPPQATWICHLTGTDCITVMDHGMLIGFMAGSSGGPTITSDSTTNLSGAIIGTDRNAKNAAGVVDSGSTYVLIDGLEADCISSGAVCTGGAIRFSAMADSARLANVQATAVAGCSLEAYSTGYVFFHNVHGDGFQTVNSGSTAIPLCVGKAGQNTQTSIYADNLVLVHPGGSSPNLKYRGGSVNLIVGKLDMEYQNNTASCGIGNSMIDVATDAVQGGILLFQAINVGANCTGSTVTVVKLEANATQIDIEQMTVGGQVGTIPISDLRAGTINATPFTQAQCTGGTPCAFHAGAQTPYYADGIQVAGMLVSRVACVNVTPVTVSANVATDQALQACPLPQQILNKVNRTLKIWTAGVYSTAATSTAQITLKVKLCTVSGCGSGTVVPLVAIQTTALGSVTVANNTWNFNGYSTTQTAGTSSVHEAHGVFSIDLAALTSAADSIFNDTNIAVSGAINSSLALFIQVTGTFSAASASNTMTGRQLIVDVIN